MTKQMKLSAETSAIAKLFLNNLYGKMASSEDSSFKFAFVKEDSSTGFVTIPEYKKKPGFIYADTDGYITEAGKHKEWNNEVTK